MRKITKSWLIGLVTVALLFSVQLCRADANNGGGGIPGLDPVVTVGADWFATITPPPAFFWGPGAGAPNLEGPFTFTALLPVWLDVTDDFQKGDQFEVFDFGSSIGLTSSVPIDPSGLEIGPEAAFNDPTYSSGSFSLSPGPHSVTFATIVNPYTFGGRGYLRVMPVPEPSTIVMLCMSTVGLLLLAWKRRN
ncbi:MAG TPA: PEP-CTERM sorting domain-containing protein [Thermoguttaceae bacterium]